MLSISTGKKEEDPCYLSALEKRKIEQVDLMNDDDDCTNDEIKMMK